MVLRALGRVGQRVRPAGDHTAHQPRLHAEGRRAFRCVQHAQAAGGSAPAVDEPPAAAHVRVNYIHRFFHLRQNLFHRGRHFFVFFVHQPQDLRSIRAVDLQRIGVALFGADRFDLYHWTCLLVARIAFCGFR